MIKQIYEFLPVQIQYESRQAWYDEFEMSSKSFYNRIEHPKAEDYKFFAALWNLPIEDLMNEVTLKTVSTEKTQLSAIGHSMKAVNFMSGEKLLNPINK